VECVVPLALSGAVSAAREPLAVLTNTQSTAQGLLRGQGAVFWIVGLDAATGGSSTGPHIIRIGPELMQNVEASWYQLPVLIFAVRYYGKASHLAVVEGVDEEAMRKSVACINKCEVIPCQLHVAIIARICYGTTSHLVVMDPADHSAT
jgi:hypothetical protein